MKAQSIKVIVNGKPYEVALGDLSASPIHVTVNGKEYEISLEQTQAEPAPVQTSTTASATPVITPAVSVTAAQPVATGSANELRAPMPGTIQDIAVKAGDKVSAAQQLCALEAMKMKSAIRSPREGVIASVEVSEGQKVAYNDVLFKYE